MYSGSDGCKCINQTSILASLQNRDCITSAGRPGVDLTIEGSCVPYDYGSSNCLQHDYLHDSRCQGDPSVAEIPNWCFQSWCYVDANSCKKNSDEDIYRSDYFQSLQSLFYSYSTCNSTDYFWQLELESTNNVLGVEGISITAIVPDYQYPMLNKKLPNGTTIYERLNDDAHYYFDDTIPFGGLYIDYINSLTDMSNGYIQNVTYTHTSRANLKRYPEESYTAAVQDVKNGLADMAVGPFWITAKRLKMTTFTVPLGALCDSQRRLSWRLLSTPMICFCLHSNTSFSSVLAVYDKTVLVVPNKFEQKNGLGFETEKVLQPFTYELWGVVLATITVSALLSVWFSDRQKIAKKRYNLHLSQQGMPWKARKLTYVRLLLDAFLEKGMFFCSAGIEQDSGASLPHKVLMFGFGFFILIAVSAYVANLAAFLTQQAVSDFKKDVGSTMELVTNGETRICGHPALEEELRLELPKSNWYFPEDGFNGPNGMFEAHARGECQVLAVGREDTVMNREVRAKMCRLNLVYTNEVLHENPIAFPIRPQLASSFSYWKYLGEKSHSMSWENIKENFNEEKSIKEKDVNAECEVELSKLDEEEVNEFAQINPNNMFLPITTFAVCAFIAVFLQLVHERNRKRGKTSSFGRQSTLDMFQMINKRFSIAGKNDDDDVCVMPKSNPLSTPSSQVRFSFGDGIPDGEFNENAAKEGVSEAKPIASSPNDDNMAMAAVTDSDGVAEVAADISHRIEQLVESGVMEEVLDCFDFFQEVKKLKKNK